MDFSVKTPFWQPVHKPVIPPCSKHNIYYMNSCLIFLERLGLLARSVRKGGMYRRYCL